MCTRFAHRGASLTELLLALPFVLLLGLLLLQTALLFHAHHALGYALFEAARHASVQGGRSGAVQSGFASGLVAFLPSASSPGQSFSDRQNLYSSALHHVRSGTAGGWLQIRRISPTAEMFAQWSEPARDDNGARIAGASVIPNDNLKYRGVRGLSQTGLTDANLLKLELRYGAPLIVPFVGPVMSWLMRQYDSCSAASARLIGLFRLNAERVGGSGWRCPMYQGLDERGRQLPRWPIRLSVTIRMQSPLSEE